MKDQTEKPLDKVGQEVKPGDYVCYAYSQWASPVQKIGRVTSVSSKEANVAGKPAIRHKVKVWLVKESAVEGLSLNKGAADVGSLGRLVVVDGGKVPAEFRDLLEQVKIKA